MLNKKRIVVFVVFLCCLFFMTTFAGAPAQNTIIATRTVEFVDGFNNRTISEQNIEVGTEAEVPSDPVHDGYIFAGWYLFDNQEVRVNDFTSILNDLKVIARYQGDANRNGIADDEEAHYTVTFIDSFDGRVLSTEEVLVGMAATAPSVPTHDGLTFTGWSTSYANVTSDITVRTVYTDNNPSTPVDEETVNYYTVAFIDTLTNRVISSERVQEGLTASTPTSPEHEGYLFVRWNGDFTNVTSDREIYTVYVRDENNNGIDDTTEVRYTITFDALLNGKIVNNDRTVQNVYVINNILSGTEFGKVVSKLPEVEANQYYIADGWNEVIPADDFKVEEDLIFTAKYLEDKNNNGTPDENETLLVVTFVDNISNKTLKTEEVLPNMAATAPTPVKYDQKIFKGWDVKFTNVIEDLTVNTVYVDDLNNNGVDDTLEENTKKVLTIEYVSLNSNTGEYNKLIEDKTIELLPGQPYSLTPEKIEWYTVSFDNLNEDTMTLDGVMPEEDTTVRFIYTPGQDKNNNGIDDRYEEDTKVSLTFRYVSLNPTTKEYNTLVPENPLKDMMLLPGESYEVKAPLIDNYKVNATSEIQKGVMGNVNKIIIFSYRPALEDKNLDGIADEEQELNTLTIKYLSYDYKTDVETVLDTLVINYVLEGTKYNVPVKTFDGYSFVATQTENLDIVMPAEDYVFTVYYQYDGSELPEVVQKEVRFNYNIVLDDQVVNQIEVKNANVGWTLQDKFDLTNYINSYEINGYKYTFNGWKTSVDGEVLTEEEFNKIIITDDIDFYANYVETPLSYPLVINYSYPNDVNTSLLETTYSDMILYGDDYTVISPVISGYVANPRIVSGTMDEIGGKIINVVYESVKPTLNVVKESGYNSEINLDIVANAYVDEDLYIDNEIVNYYIDDMIIDSSNYVVSENGEYVIKVEDLFGNITELIIVIDTVDKSAPVINVVGDENTKYSPAIHIDGEDRHNYIDIPYSIDEENISRIEYAQGNFNTVEEYKNSAQNRTILNNFNGDIRVTVDGYYTIYVLDKAGNETVKTVHISGIKENKWYSFAYKNLKTEDGMVNVYLDTTSQVNPRLRTVEITTKADTTLLNIKYAKNNERLDISYFRNNGIETVSKFQIEGRNNDIFSIYFKYEVNGIIKEDIVYTKLWVD